MEYYSAIKKSDSLSITGKWMELEITILREVSQVQKDKGHMFSLHMKNKYKYKHDHTHIHINVSNSGTV
jgi:hypothetical protein